MTIGSKNYREKSMRCCRVNNNQRGIVAYLGGLPPVGDLRHAKVNALRELQSQTQEELDALLPSAEGATAGAVRRAFKGEL